MNWLYVMRDPLMGIARHLLTTLGGSLVTGGYLTSTDATAAVGAILTLVGVGLSVAEKRGR